MTVGDSCECFAMFPLEISGEINFNWSWKKTFIDNKPTITIYLCSKMAELSKTNYRLETK